MSDDEYLNALLERSRAFERDNHVNFPTSANLLRSLAPPAERAARWARSARIVVPASVSRAMQRFVEWKREHGSAVERAFYADASAWTPARLALRLIAKRPLVFYMRHDSTLLRDSGLGRAGGFEHIGTDEEEPPLLLQDYQSYDEMMLSALLAVSVHTPFINCGDRSNMGSVAPAGTFEAEGVYIGAVGARFERRDQMESVHMLLTPERCVEENGYGASAKGAKREFLQIFADLYGVPHLPTFEEAASGDPDRFVRLYSGSLLDLQVYKARMRVTIEALLREADERAAQAGKKAFLYFVGLGHGVWAVSKQAQARVTVEACVEAIGALSLAHTDALYLAWFPPASLAALPDARSPALVADASGARRVRVEAGQRAPAAPLERPAEQLLVATFAWDGNSFAGNEYWLGALSASGDPAAACCSAIPELMNPYVNVELARETCVRIQ